jgi:hypothetical protein
MKKLLLLLLTILLGFSSLQLSAQQTLTVADGTETNQFVPIYGYWADAAQHNQVIYPETMLENMIDSAITAMTFYLSSSPSNSSWGSATFTIKFGIIADSSFASATYATGSFTEVYSGGVQVANGELTLVFDEPFVYTGGNLLFDLTSTAGSYSASTFSGISSTGGSLNAYTGSYSSDGPNIRNFIPKTTFTYANPPLCLKPSNVAISGITTTDVTISWTGGDNDSYYNIQYMLSSQTDWDNASTATAYDVTYNLTGLQPSSTYKVRVQTVCSDNSETEWSSVITFQTNCDAIPIVDSWTENFEGYTGSGQQPFQCWATPVTTPGGGPFVYCGYGEASHSPSNTAELKGYTNMLVLPEFTNDIHTLRLTFWATYYGSSTSAVVGVITDISDTSTFEVLRDAGTPGPRGSSAGGNGNFMGPFDFNNVQASSGRIAILFHGSGNSSGWNLDDFTVSFIPSCAEPTGLSTVNVTAYTADITWNEVSGTNYDVLYWATGTTDTFTVTGASLTDEVYTLSSLFPNTTYGWYVRTNCGDGSYANAFQSLTFTTPNIPVELPYEQDFETDPDPISDFTIQGSGSNQWAFGSATFKPVDPTDSTETGHSLYISDDNGTSNNYNTSNTSHAYAILDVAFDNTPMEYHLSFDYKLQGEGTSTKWDYLSVYLLDGSVEVPTNAVPSGTALLSQSNFVSDWTHVDYLLENVVGTAKKIVFYWKNDSYGGTNPPAAVDNITIIGNTCAQPNQLTATNITTNSADLSWNEVGTTNAWTVYYKAESDNDYASVAVSGTASHTLSGLNADTYYTFYVVADCSGSESNPSASYSFRTACGALTGVPYTANFDSYINDGGSEYIACWSRLASDASHMVYHMSSTTYSHAGSAGCLDFDYTPSCWTTAIMPAFEASIPVNTLMVEFWLDKTGNSGTFEVGVMTDPSDSSTFELVQTINSTTSGNSAQYYEQHFVSLANYTGVGQYIAFRASNAVQCGFRLDDVTVSSIPTCMHPTALHATSVGSDEVTIAWTEMGDATSWTVAYGEAGFDLEAGEGSTATSTETNLNITGLTSGLAYDFYVQADCGSDWEGPLTVVTGQYIMNATGSDTLTTCGTVIYDDGGATGDYSSNCNSILVLYPADANAKLGLTGTANIENSYDHLYIYDGVGTSGTQLANVTGLSQTVNILSLTGPLTLHFTSDGSVVKAGFELTTSCITCYPPTNFTAFNVSLDEATISWSGIADEYSVCVILSDTTYYTTTDTFLTLTNLMPSSTYRVYVQSLCGTDSSALSQAFTFSTSCGLFTVTDAIPWFENFESYGTSGGATSLGACWATPEMQQVDNGVSPFAYCGHAGSAYSGVSTLEMKGGPTMVVFPEFSNDINTLRISMWGNTTASNATNAGYLALGYISNIYDPTSFVAIDTIPATAFDRTGTDAPHCDFIGPYDFNGVAPQAGLRIAMRLTNVTTSATGVSTSWNFDDITISLIPNCPSPVWNSVTADDIDSHNATITWVDNDTTHTYWTVYYKAQDDFLWESVLAGPDPEALLTNLTPETTYEVYVITDCGTYEEYPDETNHITFETAIACPAPTGLAVSNIGMTTATVTWNGTASSYTVEYGVNGFTPGSGTIETASTNTIDLTGLTAGTAYTVYVTADCGGDDGSSSSVSVSFSTSLCDVADQCGYTFNLVDSWGDGWNGASIEVQQNGISVATMTIPSGGSSATEIVNLCDNVSTSLIWHSGSYDSECSFTVTGPDGSSVYASSGTLSGTLTTFTTDCSGSGPVTTYIVTLNTADANMGNVTPAGATTVNEGASFTATATALDGYHFVAWMNGTTQVSTSNPYTFNVTADITLTATFEANDPVVTYFNVSVTSANTSMGTVNSTASGSVAEGTEVTATATALEGYRFVNWTDAAGVAVSTANPYTFTVTADITLIANFELVDAIEDITLAQSINLMPNPADNYIELTINSNVEVKEAVVFNAFGQMIQTVELNNNHARIDLSNMASGMYFVRVSGDNATATKKFIKK